jgi:5-formyltetrahydrofolate cyclo-ligase
MSKEHLREKYLAQRQAMSASVYHQKNQRVYTHFFREFNMTHYPSLHTYLSCPARKEVDTWRLVHTILVKNPTIVLAVPKLLAGPRQMESRQIAQNTTFQQHSWGVQEPMGGAQIPAAAFLLVVLPVIAFDEQGYRVGYGQGYYDLFLKQCRPDVTKVGLCFEDPLPAIDDLHGYDVPMDYCVTPNQVFRWEHQDKNL